MGGKKSTKEKLLGNYADIFGEFYRMDSCKTFYSEFYSAYNKNSKKHVSLKIVSKEKLQQNYQDYLLNQLKIENDILKKCKSDYILNYYSNFESETSYIIEQEIFDCDLSEYIENKGDAIKKDKNFLIELIKSISSALLTLNENNIIHRDIQPSNIFLIETENEIGEKKYKIKLGNFFDSTYIDSNDYEKKGNEIFMAPEMAKDEIYNEKCDMWSFGITLFYTYFGGSPYGNNATFKTIMNFFYNEKFPLFQTLFPSLDILLKEKLLVYDSKKRISIKDLNRFILDKNFMEVKLSKKDIIYEFKCEKEKESFGEEESMADKVSRTNEAASIISDLDFNSLPFSLISVGEKLKFNNIIYYNTRYDINDPKSMFTLTIIKDSSDFANLTNGAFLTCINSKSLKLILEEVKSEFIKDNRIKFNIIVDDSCCLELLEILSKYQLLFDKCIENICYECIFNQDFNLDDYKQLETKNKKTALCKNQKEIIKFIENTSSKEIKFFSLIRLVNYKDYIKKYFVQHEKIASFYGNINEETYREQMEKLENFIRTQKNLNYRILVDAFQRFEPVNGKDIKRINETIIKEYTKQRSYFKDMNRWLNNFSENGYNIIIYFAARLMYSLNFNATNNIEKTTFFTGVNENDGNNKIYRGLKMKCSSLLQYILNKKKIIIFSSFTSTSKIKECAEGFSCRKEIEKLKDNLFSVIFYISNKHRENWISNGIDISKNSKFPQEEEVLFQPFSFYYIQDVKIDLDIKTADIYLETVGKIEILEERIKNGNKIKYDKELDIVKINIP